MGHDLQGYGEMFCKEIIAGPDRKCIASVFTLDSNNESIFTSFVPVRQLRILVSDKLELVEYEAETDEFFLYIETSSNEFPRGWSPSSNPRIRAVIRLNWLRDDLSLLIRDIFFDIAVGNSRPYQPTMTKIFASTGRDSFFRSKVEFATHIRRTQTTFGPLHPASGYVSFTSIAREEKPLESEFISETLQMWDRLLLERYHEHLPNPAEVANQLSRWNNTGGQLKQTQKLQKEIEKLDPGVWIMLFVKSSKGVETELKTHLPSGSGSNHKVGSTRFVQAKDLSEGIRRLIRNDNIAPLRFLLGS